jgi:hypothetical protein
MSAAKPVPAPAVHGAPPGSATQDGGVTTLFTEVIAVVPDPEAVTFKTGSTEQPGNVPVTVPVLLVPTVVYPDPPELMVGVIGFV